MLKVQAHLTKINLKAIKTSAISIKIETIE